MDTLEIVALLAALVASSIAAGILAGLLGVGGGIVIVPMLFWLITLFGFDPALAMQMAVATSLATIVFTSISSSRSHYKRGSVDTDLLKRWAVAMAIGALVGGLLGRVLGGSFLTGLFAIVALAVAINMATKRTIVVTDHLPEGRWTSIGLGSLIGLLSALMGIGGGTLSVPILSAFSFPIRKAVGTAAAFGFVIAVPAVIGFVLSGIGVPDRPAYSLGFVSLPAAAIILPFTVGFAPLGARLAHYLEPIWVKRAFALFLFATAVRMLISAFS